MADLEDDIKRYREGTLRPKERHALEKRALNDPFLEDALEGIHSISSSDFSADVSELTRKLGRQEASTWFTPLRIAAGVLLVLGTGVALLLIDFSEPTNLALQKNEVPVAMSADSLITSKKDSSASLLTLAEPEEENVKKNEAPIRSITKGLALSKRELGPDKTSVSGASSEAQPANIKESEEDKPKLSLEVIDEKEKATQSIQLIPAVSGNQGESKKKESIADKRSSGFASADDAKSSTTISGKVISTEDGSPMPGVNILVKGTTSGTVTDGNGYFQINTEIEKPELIFSFIGMETIETRARDNSSLEIKMKEDASQLSEVVVTALGIQENRVADEPIIKTASPLGGIRAYNKYLENNVRYPTQALENKVKGKVMIEFTIEADGDLADFNVLKSLGYGCDEEVIRLVKEGPKWTPTSQDDIAVDTQVKVRVKFDPTTAKK
ncbi:hypothetical protein BH10BAC4_BH10BAC4_19690 [soil metagenome]